MAMAGLPPDMSSQRLQDRVPAISDVTWGGPAKATTIDGVVAALIVLVVSCWMNMDRIALKYFDGSLSSAANALWSGGIVDFASSYYPRPSAVAIGAYAAWILFQALLYLALPGQRCKGQRTPGGQLLEYTANGLRAWIATHLVFLVAVLLGALKASVIADHWDGLVVAMDAYGIFVSAAALLKDHFAPSFTGDRKLSGSIPFYFFSGVELNPRLAYQHNTHGSITSSMIIVNILQAIYVIDFFVNEDWYLKTVDIAHDYFGFYLAYGTTNFLPQLYTIQAQYLDRYPAHISNLQAVGYLVLCLAGYALFRSANWQKDVVRRTDAATTIEGEPAKVVRTKYRTSDGKEHAGLLLGCGW